MREQRNRGKPKNKRGDHRCDVDQRPAQGLHANLQCGDKHDSKVGGRAKHPQAAQVVVDHGRAIADSNHDRRVPEGLDCWLLGTSLVWC